jgi:hypothetical protein
MREEGGMKHILAAMPKFEANHEKHIAVYGRGNERRLTGRHETASMDHFSYGMASVRHDIASSSIETHPLWSCFILLCSAAICEHDMLKTIWLPATRRRGTSWLLDPYSAPVRH